MVGVRASAPPFLVSELRLQWLPVMSAEPTHYLCCRSHGDHRLFVVCYADRFFEDVPADVRSRGPRRGERGEIVSLSQSCAWRSQKRATSSSIVPMRCSSLRCVPGRLSDLLAYSGRVDLVRAAMAPSRSPALPVTANSRRLTQQDAEAAEVTWQTPEGRVAMGCAGLLVMGFGVASMAVVLGALALH